VVSERVDSFLEMSEVLTGFKRVELLGTGMTEQLVASLDQVLPAGVLDELLDAYRRLPPGAEAEAALESNVLADSKLGPVARNVILAWYCGTWTALPDTWRAAYGGSPLDTDRVLSPEAYLGGLQWVAAGAHPAGARQQGYGAWSVPPGATP
jgi:hypothetical protein